MPRTMPPLVVAFRDLVDEALALSEAGEVAKAHALSASPIKKALTTRRLEALYEMAFLRAFVAWEVFLEAAFARYLCGYVSAHGSLPLAAGQSYVSTLADAEALILHGSAYSLWHNPTKVIRRCQRFFAAGSNFEAVVSSSIARIQEMANIRHRIAHGQKDAISKFHAATLFFVGKQYPAASPGRFLRDLVPGRNPPERWIGELSKELVALASQSA
jgi:hypothetical protein